VNHMRREEGFTVIELLVSFLLFAIVTGAFYSVLFSQTGGSETSRAVADIAEEARLGINRMVRDTREAHDLSAATADSYTVQVDFDGQAGASAGDETLTYSFHAASNTIRLNGEVLIAGVEAMPGIDIFSYSSNLLEYDWDNDGVTTLAELNAAGSQSPPVSLAVNKLIYVSNISYHFRLRSGDSDSVVRAQAEMRNHDST